ncbi:MAG: ArsA family ATPase [Thermoanaerobaculia bacterium]
MAASRWTSLSAGTATKTDPLPPLKLFGGKGGVGKTTCAAAAALAAAESGRRVLAVTTDPAPSLGDAFRAALSGEPTRIRTRKGELLAVELSALPALDRWTAEHRNPLREIAARGTYLDEDDVERFLALHLPGADELIAWLEIARLARETACDELVVDAAPTAHTLRLLAMPEALRRFAGVLDRLQERHRWMAERFGGVWRPDASDAFLAGLENQARGIEEHLRDPDRTAIFWVMLPEILSLEETRDALAVLDEAGLPVREVIVNRVLPEDDEECPLCRERRRSEAEAIGRIGAELGGRRIKYVFQEEKEPRGKEALRRIGRALASKPSPLPLSQRERGSQKAASPPGRAGLEAVAPPTLRLLLFGGKGGVGKTTCAAAVALSLAERRPDARILLLSTDPAHSVADALQAPLGDDERSVVPRLPNLRARELDAGRAFAAWRDRWSERVGEAAGTFTTDSAGVQELLDLTPPGVDELLALSTLLDAVSGDYDLVVVDTAPTGHALRLLEMPELALAWDHYLLSLLLKYREAVGLGDLASELVELSRSLKRLQELLRDPARTRFVAVTRAAELPRRETVRLLESLARLGIAVPAVVVNAVPPAGCPRCGPSGREEAAILRKRLVRAGLGRYAMMRAPAEYPPPRGVERLSRWARSWETVPE